VATRRGRRGQVRSGSPQRMRPGDFSRPTLMARMRGGDRSFRNLINTEPDEELEDSELSDWERQQAIARERTRREGLI
jgi:hypothetical protein